MYKRTILSAFILLLLSGCASGFVVQVSAIADTEIKLNSHRYVLLNGNMEDGENDLFFREFSAYFIPLLAEKGYQRVTDRETADLEVFFRYAASEGRIGVNTFTHPIYETVGGNTINFVESKTDSAGTTTTTRSTVRIPLQTLYVGTAVESRSYTLYTSSVALEAYKINPEGKILWKTLMSIISESNDLRTTVPAMAAAAAPFIAGNSETAKNIRLKRNDPRILEIRKNAKR